MINVNPEYVSYFNTIKLQKPTIIGAVLDYSPLNELLSLDIYDFHLDERKIPSSDIVKFLEYYHDYEKLSIRCSIVYKDRPYHSGIYYTSIMMRGIDTQRFIFDALIQLVLHIKSEIYRNHPLQIEIDSLRDKMTSHIGTVTTADELSHLDLEMVNNMINELHSKIDKEFDSEVLGSKHIIKLVPPRPNVKSEEVEFDEIEKYLDEGGKSLKLNLKTIRILHKEKSNKFVLPLKSYETDDLYKWEQLIKKPFKFLSYNDAMFSINLDSHWEDDTCSINHISNKYEWHRLWVERQEQFKTSTDNIERKRKEIAKRKEKLKIANNTLINQIDDLKSQFENRANKYKNPKLLKFMAERTEQNIKTIREAQLLSERKLNALQQKKLVKSQAKFFKRAAKLYLGKTGDDILKDMKVLKLNHKKDYKLAIDYLFFLMRLIEVREDKYISPVIPVPSANEFKSGFEKPKLMKLIAGHMFVHTITLSRDIQPAPPEAPPARIVTG